MANGIEVQKWKGSASFYPGDTPNGYFDNDPQFQVDVERNCIWASSKLGYPNIDVELSDSQLFGLFEEAVVEYGAQVNYMNIKNNMFTLQGNSTGSDATGKYVKGGASNVYTLAKDYGTATGLGGDVNVITTQIKTTASLQTYDLTEHGISSSAVIRNIFHYETPASVRMYNPFVGGGLFDLLRDFGLQGSAYSGVSLLYPSNLAVLRIQAVELTDMIHRSEYTFELVGSKLKVFPIPTSTNTIWIEWFDRNINDKMSASPVISDMSNMPYGVIPYKDINQPGKQWIRKYFLALCKETLGLVRSKYSSYDIPEGNVSLDGDTLRSEGIQEQEQLKEALRQDLDALSKPEVYRREADAAQALNDLTQFIPPLGGGMFWG